MASRSSQETFIESSALIDSTARIGAGTKIWAYVQVGEHAVIGENCVIGNGAYIDRRVEVGNQVRIHNKALLYEGVIVEDSVFIGPAVCFANDPWPRSGATRDMRNRRWFVRKGASIGANATILPDLEIGTFAVIGAGTVVTRAVPAFALMTGNPARQKGWVCPCGEVIRFKDQTVSSLPDICGGCGKKFQEHFQK